MFENLQAMFYSAEFEVRRFNTHVRENKAYPKHETKKEEATKKPENVTSKTRSTLGHIDEIQKKVDAAVNKATANTIIKDLVNAAEKNKDSIPPVDKVDDAVNNLEKDAKDLASAVVDTVTSAAGVNVEEVSTEKKSSEDATISAPPAINRGVEFNKQTGMWEIIKDIPENPEVAFEPTTDGLTVDQVQNIISDTKNLVQKSNTTLKETTIQNVVLVELFLCNYINSYQIFENVHENLTDRVLNEMNSFCHALAGFKLILDHDVKATDEYLPDKEFLFITNCLGKVVKSIKDNFTFMDIHNRIKNEVDRNNKIDIVDDIVDGTETGTLDEDLVDSITTDDTKVVTNNPEIRGIPEPTISQNAEKELRNLLGKILGPEYNIAISAQRCPYFLDSLIDTDRAIVQISGPNNFYKMVEVDLGSTTGTGFNLVWSIPNPNLVGGFEICMICIKKHKDLVKKILTTPEMYILNNPNDNVSMGEYQEVMNDMLPNKRIYTYFDFSGMGKNLRRMKDADKVKLSRNLDAIISLPWTANVFDMANTLNTPWQPQGIALYRSRFRDFKSPEEFTLISDKHTRVQDAANMAPTFSDVCKQYYEDDAWKNNDQEMVVEWDHGLATVYINRELIHMNKLQ